MDCNGNYKLTSNMAVFPPFFCIVMGFLLFNLKHIFAVSGTHEFEIWTQSSNQYKYEENIFFVSENFSTVGISEIKSMGKWNLVFTTVTKVRL